jgi:hypothetical protein
MMDDDKELRYAQYTAIKDEHHIDTMCLCRKYTRKGIIYYTPSHILHEKYHCIDEYVKYIKRFCVKSDEFSRTFFYGDFCMLNWDFFNEYNALDGYFYIAMIYLGYEFKIQKYQREKMLVFKARYTGPKR